MTRHGFIMVVFSLLSGFFMYLYQLAMGIMLDPQDYGALFSLTSFLSIILVSSQALSTTISRFVSKLRVERGLGSVSSLRNYFLKKAFFIGLSAFFSISLLSPLISRFLNISSPAYIIVLFSTLSAAFLFVTNMGTLNGLQRFLPLGISLVIESFLIMLLGSLLVYVGFGIYGGLIAFPVSYVIVLSISFFFLRDLPFTAENTVKVGGIGKYAIHALISVLAFTALTNIDAVLAKHYLSAFDAGNYATIAVLGRIALYAPLGISTVMFPKTAALFESGGNHLGIFGKAILITSSISSLIVLAFSLFSNLIIRFLFGNKYPSVAGHLGIYALAMALFGTCYVSMRYLLSINKIYVAYSMLGTLMFQIVLIVMFHADISQIVRNMLISSVFGLLLSLSFYLKIRKGKSQA